MFAARAAGTERVFSKTGVGKFCKFPTMTATGAPTQALVYAGGIPVVVERDLPAPHAARGCGPDVSPAVATTIKVWINGRRACRIGDFYGTDNIILSGYPKVAIF